MYTPDDRFETPDDPSKIWRYMNYDKFESIITEQILYFCSVNTLKQEDPYEGSYYACRLLNQVDFKTAKQFVNQINQCGPPVAVNCWHLNDTESMAMWKIYTRENKGIAIRTTVQKLKTAFNQFHDSVRICKINYTDEPIDHPTGWSADKFMSCMTKRKCYAYEKEVRAFLWDTQEISRTKDGSAKVPIKIDSFIEEIFVAPNAEEDLYKSVQSLITEYRLKIPVKKSPILTQPDF